MSDNRLPSVSMIVPTYNEEAFIWPCLESALDQDYPAESLEILVVDGGSQDRTVPIVESLMVGHPNLRLLHNPRRTTPAALNIGIQNARGDVIVRLDAHAVAARDYVRQCVSTLESTDAANVGGPAITSGEGLLQRAQKVAYQSLLGSGGSAFRAGNSAGYVDTVFLGAFRRQVFERHGVYDEGLVYAEDDEFNYRIRQAGEKVFLNPAIWVEYFPRTSLRDLFRQYSGYGRGKVRVLRKYHRPSNLRQLFPPAVVAGGLALVVLSFWFAAARAALACLTALYLVLAFVSGAAGMRNTGWLGWRVLTTMPLVFAAMHVGYGFGYWRELLIGRAAVASAANSSKAGRDIS